MQYIDNWQILGYNIAYWHYRVTVMLIRTKIFELRDDTYHNLSELAKAMGISVSQIYRVRKGKRRINEKFIIGAIRAFPDRKLEELFYLAPESTEEQPAEKEAAKL
ncbi:MAG: helix-turn-helix transcriptional regulator [Dehalococcoidales bacterium]|nr:helix-turn-helix transcriptional regulator [Dehalococcoidales bacterium]